MSTENNERPNRPLKPPDGRSNRPVIPTQRQRNTAIGVILKGKTFKQSAIEAGYSVKTAELGPAYSRANHSGMDMAFIEASKQLTWQPEEVKAVIRNRLLTDLSRGKSSGCERVAELLGRDKTIDLFVRSGDIQIGIFSSIGEDTKTLDIEPAKED